MRLLPVEHVQQEEEANCLAACAHMALTYLGVRASQRRLNRQLGLRSGGIPYSRLMRLEQYGVDVWLQSGDETRLYAAIDAHSPPILFVRTNELRSYWQIDTRHALLVIGYDDTHFFLNDPAFSDAPKRVLVDELMLAWLEFDYNYATITPR